MATLQSLRAEMDLADAKLIAALNERFSVAERIRAFKTAAGMPRIDAAREKAIIDRALATTPPSERDTVFGVYERIFAGSRGQIETIARGVAIKDGKILLCRAKGARSTYLPGGHIEFGETAREALTREVREELGVESRATDFLSVVENVFDQHGKRHAEINLIYRLELEGLPSESHEDWIEFVWWNTADLDAANLLPQEIARNILAL